MIRKTCLKCKVEKDLSAFGVVFQRKGGKVYGPYSTSYCKPCAAKTAETYRMPTGKPVGRPLAPWSQAMLKVLDDGEWHDIGEVVKIGSRAVPPELAYRRGENTRQSQRTAPGPRRAGDSSDAIAAGARSIARNALYSYMQRGKIERQGDRIRKKQ